MVSIRAIENRIDNILANRERSAALKRICEELSKVEIFD